PPSSYLFNPCSLCSHCPAAHRDPHSFPTRRSSDLGDRVTRRALLLRLRRQPARRRDPPEARPHQHSSGSGPRHRPGPPTARETADDLTASTRYRTEYGGVNAVVKVTAVAATTWLPGNPIRPLKHDPSSIALEPRSTWMTAAPAGAA